MDTLRPRSRSPRIRVLPGGHLLIAVTIVFGILAAHTGHNVLAALVALLLAFQAVSGFRSFRVLRGIEVAVRLPRAVDVGGVAYADVEISRPGRRGSAPALELEAVVDGLRLAVAGAYVVRLAPGAVARLRVPVAGRARGVAAVLEWRLSSAYPCDLFRRTLRFPAGGEVLVRPACRRATPPAEERPLEPVGARRALARGSGETRGLRPWRDGDPLRAISWRATARAGRVVVREEDATASARWAVVLDTTAAGAALEDAVSTAAAVVRAAADASRPVELCVAGLDAPIVVASRRGLDAALDALARFVPSATRAPRPSSAQRVFLVGERAAGGDAGPRERAPFAWVEAAPPAPSPAPTVRHDDLEAVRAPLRTASGAWSVLAATVLGAAMSAPGAVAPQVAAGLASLLLRRRAEPLALRTAGRLALLAGCVAFAFLPGGGGALVLVRFLAAFAASLHVRRRTSGEDGFLLAVLLAETALAAATTSSALAVVGAVAVTVVGHRAVGAWHALRAEERARRRGAARVGATDGVGARRAADRAAVAVLALAVPLFAALPRTDAPFLRLPQLAPTTEPGIGEDVRLGGLSRIADGEERVGIVQPRNAAARDAEPYLRVATWTTFDGTRWTVGTPTEKPTPSYVRPTGELVVPGMVWATTDARWLLSVEPAAGPRLPLPERTARVTFSEPFPEQVRRDAAGALRPERPGASPRWRFEATVGTPVGHEALARPSAVHRERPPEALARRLAPEVARVVERVAGTRARCLALEAWVAARARYALDVRLDPADPLGDFLFGVRAGHCELFASALAVALRLAGIESRLVGGYHGSRWNSTGDFWVLRRRDAHAWVEAWVDGAGWVRLDPTPPAGRATQGYDGALGAWARVRDALVFAWDQQVLGFDAERQRGLVVALRGGFTAVAEQARRHAVAVGAGVVAVAMAALGTFALRRRRRGRPPGGVPLGVSAGGGHGEAPWFYDDALEILRARGWGRRGVETPRAYVTRLRDRLPVRVSAALAELTLAHELLRFGARAAPDPARVADGLAALRGVPRRPRREVDTRASLP